MISSNNVDSKLIDLYENSKFDILKFLLENNLINNLAFADKNGDTLLHHIIYKKDMPYLSFILNYIKKNGNRNILDIQNSNGDTPLHLAIKRGDQQIAALLDAAGASKSISNNDNLVISDNNNKKNNIFNSVYNTLFKDTTETDSEIFPDTLADMDSVEENDLKQIIKLPTKNKNNDDNKVEVKVLDMFVPPSSINNELNDFVKNLTEQQQKGGKDHDRNREDISKIHENTITKIKDLMKISEIEARGYKAIIYQYVKENFPDLNSFNRAKKMEEITTKDFIEKYQKDHPDKIKDIMKIVKERYTAKQNKPSISTLSSSTKPKKESTKTTSAETTEKTPKVKKQKKKSDK